MTPTTALRGMRPPQLKPLRSRLDESLALLRLAVPIMLIALVNMGMSVTDTIMVSASFGADALAAVAVGSDLYSILFYLGAGTIGGLAPVYAGAVAQGDRAGRVRLERAGQSLVLLLSAVLVPVVWTAPDWLARIGLEPGLLEAGRGYTRAMALSLAPMLGVMLYRTILTAAERPRVFLHVTVAMLPLNALGNHVLMKGAGPVPAFGPTGAGLSTLLVAVCSLATLAVIARRAAPPVTEGRRPLCRPDLARVLRLGLPIGIATVAELGIFLAATLYAATLGAAEVAAHTLTLRVAGVFYAVPAALLQAAMVRMARVEAEADDDRCRRVIRAALGLGTIAGALLCLALLAGAAPLAAAFFGQGSMAGAAAAHAVALLGLLGVMELVANPGTAAAGLLRGRKDTRAPMVHALAGYWLIGAPVGLWLGGPAGWGISGVWAGLTLGTMVTSAMMLARLARV